MSHNLDLGEILERAELAYTGLVANFEGSLPLDVREHFNRDVPALISAVKRLDVELHAANGMLEVSASGIKTEYDVLHEENVRLAALVERYRRVGEEIAEQLAALADAAGGMS
ncbi:hypothetical protein [Winogradskya humida]|uniref:Uncharacterized protein n=1 Tax=Winogradskya humida TaxID=113566 RepID=A0ABQ4A735_9ACTN|nr:hypothetical protein [Actinoplanes humidus]GIE26671.1 hypothetical protein Ahu01nite_097730 [Actinoplanes humidus]